MLLLLDTENRSVASRKEGTSNNGGVFGRAKGGQGVVWVLAWLGRADATGLCRGLRLFGRTSRLFATVRGGETSGCCEAAGLSERR